MKTLCEMGRERREERSDKIEIEIEIEGRKCMAGHE